jgi:repressor LexA
MIDGESTVKRLSRKGDRLVLSPENSAYPDIPIPADADFRITGVVVGVIRLPGR